MLRASFSACIFGWTFAIPAHAQVFFTPTSVYYDQNANTTMGQDALNQEYTTESISGCYSVSDQNYTCGDDNTAGGYGALASNVTGSANSAFGSGALLNNFSGYGNTAVGYDAILGALGSDGVANNNSALGYQTLWQVTSGSNNTAAGYQALMRNQTGGYNTATGAGVLLTNNTGNYNTASGYEALYENTSGDQNSAYGLYALHDNVKGNYNVALGGYALYSNTAGSSNVALGYKAGFYPTAGANNIHIGNLGASNDTDLIKIGTQGTQKTVYIAGASGAVSSGTGQSVAQLFVNTSTGQVGIQSSSARFKTAIEPMGNSTAKLEELRPVRFQYKTDPRGARQYGLIAEEVAKVYPELVVRDAKGQTLSVRYDELAPMLLNELKLQATQIRELKASVLALQASEHGK